VMLRVLRAEPCGRTNLHRPINNPTENPPIKGNNS
jgi:hypothetical protein